MQRGDSNQVHEALAGDTARHHSAGLRLECLEVPVACWTLRPVPYRGRDAGRPAPPAIAVGMRISAHPPRRSKGQRRKLNALRKSVGNEIGTQAFPAWLSSQQPAGTTADASAALIVDTL